MPIFYKMGDLENQYLFTQAYPPKNNGTQDILAHFE